MRFTRGEGLLENYLSTQRALQANRLIINELREGSILDIGCGSYPFFLMNTVFNTKYGIDPEAKSVPGAPAIKLYHLFMEKDSRLPFDDHSLSVVTSLGTMEHFDHDNILNLFRESYRVLRSDGQLILTAPQPWTDCILRGFSAVNMISNQEIQHARNIRSSNDLISLLIRSGFQKQNISFGWFEWGVNRWFSARTATHDGK